MDFDNAQTNYDSAVAQLKSLEQQVQQQKVELRYYRVSAPMDGIVGDIPVRVGDRVTVSTLLTTVDERGAGGVFVCTGFAGEGVAAGPAGETAG